MQLYATLKKVAAKQNTWLLNAYEKVGVHIAYSPNDGMRHEMVSDLLKHLYLFICFRQATNHMIYVTLFHVIILTVL